MTEIHRIGPTLLSAGDGASRDQRDLNIVFIHGLRGHPRTTWSHLRSTSTSDRDEDTDARIDEHKNIKSFFRLKKSKKEKNNQGQTSTSIPADIFWPEEYLVPDLPQARIWTYGYNADVIRGLFQANNQNSVSQHGRDLAVQLDREIDNQDPIVFVVHSLGGIIVKDIGDDLQTNKADIFLGTPHRGSSYAGWGEIASNLASLGLQDSNKRLVQALEVNGEVLDNIHEEFKTIIAKCAIKVHSFQEAKGISGMKGLDSKVVDNFSSKLDLAREQETVETIDANHMEMARCSSRDDARYRQIHGVLKQFIRTELLNRETNLANTTDRSCPVGFLQPPLVATAPPIQINVSSRAIPKESPSERTLPVDIENLPSNGFSTSDWTILHAAVNYKSVKGVRSALSKGADPNCETDDKRFTPLWVAACHGLLEITRLLLDAGANVNAVNFEGTTPLKEAAQIGATEVVRLLIERGANLDHAPYVNKDGPLIVAAAKGHIEVVRLLLTAGANSRAQQSGGWSCLHYALLNKNKEMTALVLEYCPNVNASTRVGLRPLHLASMAGFANICSQLVNLGAEVEARDSGGLTALRVAVQAGELEVVKMLIKRGAKTDTVGGKDGHSLIEVALILGHDSVYHYLEEQTAL